jgi:hypothetical protein
MVDREAPYPAPRLTIELVPSTCWFTNVRDRVSRRDWDRIRLQAYERAGRRCEACGGRGSQHPVECHEVWDYDETTAVQRLLRLIALCPACHEVKHMGLAGIKGRGEIAAAHLAEVNGWTAQVTAGYIDAAFATWKRRSSRTWSLDLSVLAAYGIHPAIIAEANEASAKDRSQRAVLATAEVRSCEVRVIPQSEIDSYINHLMYEV